MFYLPAQHLLRYGLLDKPIGNRLFEGRFAPALDDVQVSAAPALRHRILLNFEGEAEGVKTDDVIAEILAELPEAQA